MRLLILAVLSAACTTPPTQMRVTLEPGRYAASMSSTPGIGLSPIAEAPPGVKTRCVWHADAGHFLAWTETTREIVELGRDHTGACEKTFWTYAPNEPAALSQKPIAVSVVTLNAKNSRALARTDLTLIWEEGYVRAAH